MFDVSGGHDRTAIQPLFPAGRWLAIFENDLGLYNDKNDRLFSTLSRLMERQIDSQLVASIKS